MFGFRGLSTHQSMVPLTPKGKADVDGGRRGGGGRLAAGHGSWRRRGEGIEVEVVRWRWQLATAVGGDRLCRASGFDNPKVQLGMNLDEVYLDLDVHHRLVKKTKFIHFL